MDKKGEKTEIASPAAPAKVAVPADRKPTPKALQRTAGNRAVQTLVAAARSKPGAPLAAPVRAAMERRLGVGFGAVRVHVDPAAADAANAVHAKAFTSGDDVFFNAGRFNPDSQAGKELLAHELTHVAQQGGPVSSGPTRVASAKSPAEREAAAGESASETVEPGAIYRTPEDAQEYLADPPYSLAEAFQNVAATASLQLNAPEANWVGGGEAKFKKLVAMGMFEWAPGYDVTLARAFRPMLSSSAILEMVDRGIIDGTEGAEATVAAQFATYIQRQMQASLDRILPRYLKARNQTSFTDVSSLTYTTEPDASQILASAPVDISTIFGLRSEVVAFDFIAYQTRHPDEGKKHDLVRLTRCSDRVPRRAEPGPLAAHHFA